MDTLVCYAGIGIMDHVALYGNARIGRSFCSACQAYSLVLGGHLLCCGAEITFNPTAIVQMSQPQQKRRRLSSAIRRSILENQGHRCLYCGQPFGQVIQSQRGVLVLSMYWDHVDPYSYSFNNAVENFVAACQLCNGWKGSLSFSTIEEIRAHVRRKWSSILPVCAVPEEFPKAKALAEVLQPAMPRPSLEPAKPKDQHTSKRPKPPQAPTASSNVKATRSRNIVEYNAARISGCFVPKGVAQHLLDHPEQGQCWCGKVFTKHSDNQPHCSSWHRNLASIRRCHLGKIPPAVKQERKAKPLEPQTADTAPSVDV